MTQTIAAAPLRPYDINWLFMRGPVLRFKRLTREQILAADLLTPDEMPDGVCKGGSLFSRGFTFHYIRGYPGYFNVWIHSDRLQRNAGFKRFMGSLLADSRLSLVRGECHD